MTDDPQSPHLAAQLRRVCTGFDIKNKKNISSVVGALTEISQSLASSDQVRRTIGSDHALWSDIRKLWRDLARAQLTFWDGEDSEIEEGIGHRNEQERLRELCVALAKFTRNLVAGVPENQERAFENEPDIRRLLHYYTSWSAMEDSKSISAARIITQALSNLVTANEALVSQLWETYLVLPEDQVVIIRLLCSSDPQTLLSTLIFILNCIHESRKRMKLLCKTMIGARICVSLLDGMVRLYDAEEGTDGAQAFDIGYNIFTQLIEECLVPDLYNKLSIADEIIAPHQTTLLKLVDSYLQSIPAESSLKPHTIKIHIALSPFLARSFYTLSAYVQNAIRCSVSPVNPPLTAEQGKSSASSSQGQSPPSFPAELDIMLPKVCEALVLVTQCIVAIVLAAEEQKSKLVTEKLPITAKTNMKVYFNETRFASQGLVESLTEVLRLLDEFLPRINFGRPVDTTPLSLGNWTPTQRSFNEDSTGFPYLKRDLVRLLGVLSYKEKTVQDRTRKAAGITVVLNLCVVDERNPYLREHAILTLHNLLENNSENQAIVDAMKSSNECDEDGILQRL